VKQGELGKQRTLAEEKTMVNKKKKKKKKRKKKTKTKKKKTKNKNTTGGGGGGKKRPNSSFLPFSYQCQGLTQEGRVNEGKQGFLSSRGLL